AIKRKPAERVGGLHRDRLLVTKLKNLNQDGRLCSCQGPKSAAGGPTLPSNGRTSENIAKGKQRCSRRHFWPSRRSHCSAQPTPTRKARRLFRRGRSAPLPEA